MINPKDVGEYVRSYANEMQFNIELMDIYEGNLSRYILNDLKAQMSPQTFKQAQFRLAPINILPKIIDKLTNIYQTSVTRLTDNESDQKTLDWFVDEMDVNNILNCANEIFNLTGAALIQPYANNSEPYLRVIGPGTYVPYSDSLVTPEKPTEIILCHKMNGRNIYWVYSDVAIYAVDDEGKILKDLMTQKNMDGTNPIGKLPFVYVNSSKYRLMPCPDIDGLKIVKLLPLMLSDLNYAAMFQCFSIIYGINVDEEDLKMAPNAFWRFKSDLTNDKKPEIGVLKPQVDYTQVLSLIQSQLSMWLGTKGIRASSVGSVSVDNFASGISKVIDEMDTYEAREKQIDYFEHAEDELWELVLKDLYPYWIKTNQVKDIGSFSLDAEVEVKFTVQLPLQTRGQVVKDLQLEVAAGFTTRERAIAELNPQLTSQQITSLLQEIEMERTGNGVAENQPIDTQDPGSQPTDATSGSNS